MVPEERLQTEQGKTWLKTTKPTKTWSRSTVRSFVRKHQEQRRIYQRQDCCFAFQASKSVRGLCDTDVAARLNLKRIPASTSSFRKSLSRCVDYSTDYSWIWESRRRTSTSKNACEARRQGLDHQLCKENTKVYHLDDNTEVCQELYEDRHQMASMRAVFNAFQSQLQADQALFEAQHLAEEDGA